ncbi:MAG: insulinase family protein [Elusimicrobia bacterium]|nr:insulinase family protein [Elusimicrobiota bacterium]
MKPLPTRAFRLPNGLRVVVQTDRSVPLVALSITYRVGSLDEEPGRAGFAHLFEHLMFQGTELLPPNGLSKLVESHGGSDNAYTMKTNTTYHEVVPSWALEAALWGEADRMRGLRLSPRELEIEKRVVLEEMSQSYFNQPYRRAADAEMGTLAFARWESAHPTIGEEADLRAASLEDVRRFYDLHYAPDNAALALVGDVSPAQARRLALRYFGAVPRRPRRRRPAPAERRPAAPRRRRVEDPLASAPLLVRGWHAPPRGSADYWALTALAAVLAGGEDGPLHQELVKSRRLALSVSAHMPYWSSHHNARGADLFGLFATLRAEADPEEALAAVEGVLARLRREGPSVEELARARVQLERAWFESQQSLVERAQTLSSYAALVGDPAGLRRDLRRLLAASPRGIAAAARRWLPARRSLTLEIVPGPPRPAIPPSLPSAPPPEESRGPAAPPPPPGPPRAPSLPVLARGALACGLDVLVLRDPRLPLVEARLGLRAGRVHEEPGEDALSPACEEMLFKGCEGQDAASVARAFAGLGWAASAASEPEWLKIAASGLSRRFAEFCAQLGRVLASAAYPDDETALWRENAVQELAVRRSQPSFLADERLRAELFGAHPYGRGAPDEAAIEAVNSARLRAFHAARLRPAGGYLVLAGDVDPDAAVRILEDVFAFWPSGPVPAAAAPLPERGPGRAAVVARPGSSQASLLAAQTLALAPKDPDYADFAAANHVLGGTANSRLFENLRTRRGYTYGAYSSFDLYARGAVWSAAADVRPDAAKAALAEIRVELGRLIAEPIPEEALSAAKRHMAGLFLMRLSSLDRAASYLSAVVEGGRDPAAAMASYQSRLDAVTPESARRAAAARLDPERLIAVAVGDPAVLDFGLDPSGSAQVC